jgi:hypothetical protein
MKYIVMDEKRDIIACGDIYTEEFETLYEAIKGAEHTLWRLTDQEKKKRTISILESFYPDEDHPDHWEGNVIWKDGNLFTLSQVQKRDCNILQMLE